MAIWKFYASSSSVEMSGEFSDIEEMLDTSDDEQREDEEANRKESTEDMKYSQLKSSKFFNGSL